jgi:DNA-binding NtrC family response regulator
VKSPSVLLVIEEPKVLEIYASWLRSRGYQILMCNTPAEGINFLETEDVWLVIVSQGSSAFEGRQVLERSVELHPGIPVLVIARVLDMSCYLEAMDLGAIDYLERPEPENMAWVVETQMRRVGTA